MNLTLEKHSQEIFVQSDCIVQENREVGERSRGEGDEFIKLPLTSLILSKGDCFGGMKEMIDTKLERMKVEPVSFLDGPGG